MSSNTHGLLFIAKKLIGLEFFMRDISPAAKQMSGNILNWLGYSVIACGQALPGETK